MATITKKDLLAALDPKKLKSQDETTVDLFNSSHFCVKNRLEFANNDAEIELASIDETLEGNDQAEGEDQAKGNDRADKLRNLLVKKSPQELKESLIGIETNVLRWVAKNFPEVIKCELIERITKWQQIRVRTLVTVLILSAVFALIATVMHISGNFADMAWLAKVAQIIGVADMTLTIAVLLYERWSDFRKKNADVAVEDIAEQRVDEKRLKRLTKYTYKKADIQIGVEEEKWYVHKITDNTRRTNEGQGEASRSSESKGEDDHE